MVVKLDLRDLGRTQPGFTAAYGASLAEAAAVCLENQGHESGVVMSTNQPRAKGFRLEWATLDGKAAACWADEPFATEQGAYGVAALLVEMVEGLTVVERSRKGSGFDYWLGPRDDDAPLFQSKARLEVSGIRTGTEAGIRARMRQKLAQTARSADTGLTAIVVVVEFGMPRSEIAAA